MYTYEVWIRGAQYQGKLPLTYTSTEHLLPGVIVRVSLRKRPMLGVVKRVAPAPKGVALKPIDEVLTTNDNALPKESLGLISWLNAYYPAGSGTITQLFLPQSWPRKPRPTKEILPPIPHKTTPKLTKEQASAVKQLKDHKGTAILHGITGSGKTRVYIELIKHALNQGKSSLVLVPEIGLTPQLYNELVASIPDTSIHVLHSGMSVAQRRNVWLKVLYNQDPQIVVGPRSALFAPLKNIGCIIVDECHDDSYKQDNAPYYHALRVASQLSILHDAVSVFGSATPSVNDMYVAKQKNVPIIRLTKLAKKSIHKKSKPLIINKKTSSEFTKSAFLSNKLIAAIKNQIEDNQQSLLFLNRRGSARVVMCSMCGWRALCPRCDLPMTFHEDMFQIRCHTCGYNQSAPTSCPECNNIDILFLGPGTKALEKNLKELFPSARVARFDSDNVAAERLDRQLDSITKGEVDIVIGTQILVKGFDIPKLGLVAVVDADANLGFPDFSTEEKMFQLINQAIGRVDRGHVPGNVIVQTIDPESRLLKQALTNDWEGFYQDQLEFRKAHNFPPFTYVLKLECRRKNRLSTQTSAAKLKDVITREFPDVTVLGPAPSFFEKQHGYYSWQLIVKSSLRSRLLQIIEALPSGWRHNIDPTHLL